MGVAEFRQRLAGLHLVALDTMVFIYHLADHPRYAPLTNVIKLVKRFVGHREASALGGFIPWIFAVGADRFDNADHNLP